MSITAKNPIAIAAVEAIRSGNGDALERLLAQRSDLAMARIGDENNCNTRTLLHVVTDWPGHLPNGPAMVAILVAAGADVNARFGGSHSETPLHWAASSDDVEVLDALVAAGADIEAPGAVIVGGTPLDDAVAFGQWRAAHRLVEHGAHTALWHAAALGLIPRIEAVFAGQGAPSLYPWGHGGGARPDDITVAFWCACHGGQRTAAEYLLHRGADLNWASTWDQLTPLDAARRARCDELVTWLRTRGAMSVDELAK